jgi:hypothetical protein
MTRHWTAETDAEAVVLFDSLPTKEIRQRQDLCRQQMGMIDNAPVWQREDSLADLIAMDEALFQAMMRRT